MSKIFKTVEFCNKYHPDFVADAIADNILAEMFEQDKCQPHAGIEILLYKGGIVIGGEMKTSAYIDVPEVVRNTVLGLGYNDASFGLDGEAMAIMNCINKQSPCIDVGVSRGDEIGSGDQGFEFGFASDETPALLPLPNVIGMSIAKRLNEYTNRSILGLDGKGMVTVAYDEETDEPLYIDTLVLSNCYHSEDLAQKAKEILRDEILAPAIAEWGFDINDVKNIYINPTGSWLAVNSCSAADCGVVGRKLVAKSYMGCKGSLLGGGAFDGKDPSKTDFSGMVAGRYVAKNIVATGFAKKVQVVISYAIGVAEPIAVEVDTFGTSAIPNSVWAEAVREVFDLTPKGIIEQLDLYNPEIYRHLTCNGLFDQHEDFRWEWTDKVEDLKKFLSK